jgi:formylmethanofuran dehydrogenase subunit E-like metal-binding protein
MRLFSSLAAATFAALLLSVSCASATSPAASKLLHEPAARALEEGMAELEVSKGDARVLLMTNAGYARPGGRGTEFFADVATEVSGCSIGKGNLHFLHSPATAPLWFSLYRRDTRRAFFGRWREGAFESRVLELDPALLTDPDAWAAANSGPVRGSLFSILSFSNAWAQGADPLLLKCAEFHNHCCGGVTAGYLTGRYIQANLPLRDGEEYVFVTASPSCAMDALQVMFDATAGKKGMFSTKADAEDLSDFAVGDARPLTLVMRVNEKADTCDGLLVGFAWGRTGQASKLWNVAEVQERDCVTVLKRFSGPASLARASYLTGVDPYDAVWEE